MTWLSTRIPAEEPPMASTRGRWEAASLKPVVDAAVVVRRDRPPTLGFQGISVLKSTSPSCTAATL